MSIEAVEAIEKFLHRKENGLSLAEIKKKCEEFVMWRDRHSPVPQDKREETQATHYLNYFIRDGQLVKRDKLVPYKDQIQ